jgi:8-oxo-dGTP pyrophosphatase MutT (NUDIX family)
MMLPEPLSINPNTIADRLAWEGARSSLRFNPELAYGRHRGPAPASARRAAVLLALWRETDEWFLTLTLRRNDLSRHRGQVSFPGGYVDPGETSSAAAVREFHEETGCDQPPQLLGSLPECYVYVSNTVVTPWVGLLPGPPQWYPNPAEVERIIIVPLAALVADGHVHTHAVKRGALEFTAACYRLGETDVWGATAIILDTFIAIAVSGDF